MMFNLVASPINQEITNTPAKTTNMPKVINPFFGFAINDFTNLYSDNKSVKQIVNPKRMYTQSNNPLVNFGSS